MPDYKKLYFALFRASAEAAQVLLDAQKQAEEEILQAELPPLHFGEKGAAEQEQEY